MKQCDRSLSPFTISSSSLSFAPSESDPADSFWGDFNFDFSFMTSEDQKTGLDSNEDDDDDDCSDLSHRANVTTRPKVEESKLSGLTAYELGNKGDFARPVRENFDSFLKLPNFLESDLKYVDSKLSLSLAVESTSHCDFNVITSEGKRSQHIAPTASVPEVSSIIPVAKSASVDNDNSNEALCTMDKSASLGKFLVRKDLSKSNPSPFFSKAKTNMCNTNRILLCEKSSLRIDQDDTEVDSPCWRGKQSPSTAASGIKSLNFKRSNDDPSGLHGLNPLAPHFIPSNAKKTLEKNGRVFKENSSSLKKSLSSSFRLSTGEFGITDHFEAGIEQGSDQNNKIGIQIHNAGESLGLATQDSDCMTMSILDISKEFQNTKKLDPLAPVFVPACPKLNGKHGATDHIIAIDTNVNSTSALSSTDSLLLNNVKVETHSSKVDHSLRNHYSDNFHEWGTTYSSNPHLGSQVENSVNTKLNSSSNKSHGQKKLNPLAPQFSPPDTKRNVYGYGEKQAATDLSPMVNSSVLVSPIGYTSYKELHAGLTQSSGQQTDDRHGCFTTSSSPKMDVKKLLMTIHGLSELLLTHVHSSETSDSPNEEYLDLIKCTVQNLNSYIDNRVQEHTGKHASAVHSSCDLNSFSNMCQRSVEDNQLPKVNNMSANSNIKKNEKYSMISGDMVPDSHFRSGVSKENGFDKVRVHHQTEELIDPQVLFYKSLCLKAKADKSMMEYETLLSRTST